MNKLDKRGAPALAAAGLGVLLLASGAAWAAGEQDDPLITLGYLNKVALPQVVEQVEAYIAQMKTLFVLENLDNLKKNGRLTRVQAMLTGALRIKLIMGSTPEGEICKHGQALSIKQALAKIVDIMAADERHIGKILYNAQCLCPDRAQQLKKLAKKSCQFAGVVITATRGLSSYYANSGGVVVAY